MNSVPAQAFTADLGDPLYYLHNFRFVLDWIGERYGDLLDDSEHAFLRRFPSLPESSQALFVRMVMRKGEHFRLNKLLYQEVGDADLAMAPLVQAGWVEPEPTFDIALLFRLFTKHELRQMLAESMEAVAVARGAAKSEWFDTLAPLFPEPLTASGWGTPDPVCHLGVMPLCDRFRLMFFGNLRQSWSEFVLAELGTFRYEPVLFDQASRPFQHRDEVTLYLHLHQCREQLEEGGSLEVLEDAIPERPAGNAWLAERRDRLVFQVAREWERAGEYGRARALYQDCFHAGARGRLLRVMELQQDFHNALTLARQAVAEPESEAERQQLSRLMPRLHRKLALPMPEARPPVDIEHTELTLPPSPSVELAVKEALSLAQAPVYYVENGLINGLFGLLCWEAIFAPLPGAFFHPFQSGPADLNRRDFYSRREPLFEACLCRLEDGSYRDIIVRRHAEKWGTSSPFVNWNLLTERLLERALDCIPPAHLGLFFRRLLADIRVNRAGWPDLIRFWPLQQRYQMVEVKGPGDRLQDNQRRWLDYFVRHEVPVAVCHVQWGEVAP